MRAFCTSLPQTERDWGAFVALALFGGLQDLESTQRVRDVVRWSWMVQDSAARCEALLRDARRLQDVAERWHAPAPSLGIVVDELLRMFRSRRSRLSSREIGEFEACSIAQKLQAVAALTGICPTDLLSDIFAPCPPLITTGDEPVLLRQLCSLEEVVELGKAMWNCLASEVTAISYAARGPLFELTDSRGMLGTLALSTELSAGGAVALSIREIDHFAEEDPALVAAIENFCIAAADSPDWIAYAVRLAAWREKMEVVVC